MSVAVPIYHDDLPVRGSQSTTANLFGFGRARDIYSRINEPDETRCSKSALPALDVGVAALALASGHSRLAVRRSEIARPGTISFSSPDLYGRHVNLFLNTIMKTGRAVRLSTTDPRELRVRPDERTRCYYYAEKTPCRTQISEVFPDRPWLPASAPARRGR